MGSLGKIDLPTVYSLGQGGGRKPVEEAALKAFDAYFLGEMLRQSRPTNTTGLFDGGQAGRMYQDHLYQEMARIIAEKGDFGMAASLKGTLGGDGKDDPAAEADQPDPSDPLQKMRAAAKGPGPDREEGS